MNGRKKILFVITKSNWGGAQRYVYDIATSLPTSEFEVAVACGGNGLLVSMLREKNIPVFEIKSFQRDISFRKEFSSLFELWKLYKMFKPDVVHLNSSKAGGVGAFVARLAGIQKILFTAHGWPFWEQRNMAQKILIVFFSWLTIVFTHKTICISEYDVRIGQRMPFVKNKIHLIRNGIAMYEPLQRDIARLKLFDQTVIEEHAHDIWVLTNAELTPNKNHLRAIDAVIAYNQSASEKIFYVCMGDGELRETLSVHIKKNNAENYIVMLGFVPRGYLYYGAFDIFFLPSLKEGVPYVLLEAGIAGLACIAGNVGGIPEVITHEKSGLLVTSSNTEELKKALQNLCKNETKRSRFGAGLKKTIAEQYSKDEMLTQTKRVYVT
ncbi:MAG: glycosyltransferase [Candidatus Campbellbacteria bacterium]|nr:glycosyltransferase [Candidatus Campbellbacteria bacterium]